MSRFEHRVLVCGGRQFDQPRTVGRALAAIHVERPIDLIISGGAAGADRYAEQWAQHNRIALSVWPANWRFDGKAAGPIRNERMLRLGRPHLVVAFPGGPGTAHMVRLARAAGVAVVEPCNPAENSAGVRAISEQGNTVVDDPNPSRGPISA